MAHVDCSLVTRLYGERDQELRFKTSASRTTVLDGGFWRHSGVSRGSKPGYGTERLR